LRYKFITDNINLVIDDLFTFVFLRVYLLGHGVDGKWGTYTKWSEWGECSSSCGKGWKTKTRSRACNNPQPQYGGQPCKGDDVDIETHFLSKSMNKHWRKLKGRSRMNNPEKLATSARQDTWWRQTKHWSTKHYTENERFNNTNHT
jgi:hypothetical protein